MKHTLATLKDLPPASTGSDRHLSLYERQRVLEEQSVSEAKERLRLLNEQLEKLTITRTPTIRDLIWKWFVKFSARIRQEQDTINQDISRGRPTAVEMLALVDADRTALVVINYMLRTMGTGLFVDGARSANAFMSIGKFVEMEYRLAHSFNASKLAKKRNYVEQQKRIASEMDRKVEAKLTEELTPWVPFWPLSMRVRIGGALVSMLMEVATVSVPNETDGVEEVSALFHTYSHIKGQHVGTIQMHPQVHEILSKDRVMDTLDPRFLPMLVPPRPWVTVSSGGYLTVDSLCMRIKRSKEQLHYLRRADKSNQLHTVLTGLDVLGATPWRINQRVFTAVLNAWNSGYAFPSIPSLRTNFRLPDKPLDYTSNSKARAQWTKQVTELTNDFRNDHSLRCDVNYKVEIARAFLDQVVYFPHNLDFRGRAYPIPPLFNHLGNDLCRGLLLFAEGRPLGPDGLRWLKIQLANLAGYDKYSHADRVAFVDERLSDIHKAAQDPMALENSWWLQVEDPWQCLAACIEVSEAIESGCPEEYISHLPVHQDGTCNGLQHYAALGGDWDGANQVNLVASDKPQDVYSGVAALVEQLVKQDALDGVPEAALLHGKITRKIVKQTVMTNVYGVTFSGARDQIRNRLREVPELQGQDHEYLATYVARKVFSSLGQMFSGARAIQDWLNEAARRIAKSFPRQKLEEAFSEREQLLDTRKQDRLLKVPKDAQEEKKMQKRLKLLSQPALETSVVWTTPLGLPIVQPYRRYKGKVIKTRLQHVLIEDPSVPIAVNAQKQRTAFPPNYIHSLDATHMLLSAIACSQQRITFAAVHDSYWTHASTVQVMSQVLREQFVRLHSGPLMENLLVEFKKRYRGHYMPKKILQEVEEESSIKEINELFIQEDEENERISQLLACQSSVEASEHESVLGESLTEEKEAFSTEWTAEEEEAFQQHPDKQRVTFKHWVPLQFPPLPERGTFNVANVKSSPYFFH